MSALLTGATETALFDTAGSFLTIIPKGNIGGIEVQATIEEVYEDRVEVTDHPVQAGAQITDHSFNRPSEIVMRCGWSNASPDAIVNAAVNVVNDVISGNLISSLVDGSFAAATDYVSNVYNQLLALMQQRQTIDIVTTLRQYQNMLLTGLQVNRDQKTSQALMLTATCRQIIIVSTASSTLAPIANQALPASTAGTTQAGSQSVIPSGTVDIPGFYDNIPGGSDTFNPTLAAVNAGVS